MVLLRHKIVVLNTDPHGSWGVLHLVTPSSLSNLIYPWPQATIQKSCFHHYVAVLEHKNAPPKTWSLKYFALNYPKLNIKSCYHVHSQFTRVHTQKQNHRSIAFWKSHCAKTWSKNTYPHRYPEFLHWVTSNSLASQSHSISKATICTRKNCGPIASWHHYHTKLRFWSMICTFDHPKVTIKSYIMSMPTDCTIKMDPLLVALPQHKSLNSRQRF